VYHLYTTFYSFTPLYASNFFFSEYATFAPKDNSKKCGGFSSPLCDPPLGADTCTTKKKSDREDEMSDKAVGVAGDP